MEGRNEGGLVDLLLCLMKVAVVIVLGISKIPDNIASCLILYKLRLEIEFLLQVRSLRSVSNAKKSIYTENRYSLEFLKGKLSPHPLLMPRPLS